MIKLKTFMHCKGGQFCHVSIKIVISKENNGLGKTFLRMPGLPKDQYFFMLWPFNKRMSPERWTQTNNRTQQRQRVKNYCFLWVKRRIHNRMLRSIILQYVEVKNSRFKSCNYWEGAHSFIGPKVDYCQVFG